MAGAELVLYQEEFQRLDGALKKLRQEANARAIFLIDKNGQQIAAAGEVDQFDTTSLASLTAGNVAATDAARRMRVRSPRSRTRTSTPSSPSRSGTPSGRHSRRHDVYQLRQP